MPSLTQIISIPAASIITRGQDALRCIEAEHIDLAILDIMLPDTDGFTLCRRIREKHFFPVIMLTARIEETDKVNGFMLGADDYITKPFHALEVIARVKAQLRRADLYNRRVNGSNGDDDPAASGSSGNDNVSGQPGYYELRGLELDAPSHRCTLYGRELPLTPTEFRILHYLFCRLGQVATSEEIFEAVWEEKYFEGNNTVFVHIARIREKMSENSRKPKFIKTVWGVGYKLD